MHACTQVLAVTSPHYPQTTNDNRITCTSRSLNLSAEYDTFTCSIAVADSSHRSSTLRQCSHPETAEALLQSGSSCLSFETALGYANDWFPLATVSIEPYLTLYLSLSALSFSTMATHTPIVTCLSLNPPLKRVTLFLPTPGGSTAPLILNIGQHHAPERTPVPTVQEVGWASGPVWMGPENLALVGLRTLNFKVGIKSLYRLHYPWTSACPPR